MVLQIMSLSQGGITGTVADTRLILAGALKVAAPSIVVAHNYPSSNLKPSRLDTDLTQKIKLAPSYHNIRILDHLIATSDSYYSFSDEGLL